MPEAIRQFGKQYGPLAFGVVVFFLIWQFVVLPEKRELQEQAAKLLAVAEQNSRLAEVQAEISRMHTRISASQERITEAQERIAVMLSTLSR